MQPIKEYRTIEEVAGPLMLIKKVEGVKYDELGEIELPDGSVRPVYLYAVDADEFVVNKLLDRGSLSATTMVTNVQDFITKVARDLGVYPQ